MKKRTKIILGISGGLCLAGIGLMGIGIIAGGSDYLFQADLNKMDGSATTASMKKIEEQIQLDEFQAIDVDLDNYDFEIQTSEDEHYYLYCRFAGDREENPLSYDVKDNTLTLKEKDLKSDYFVNVELMNIDLMKNFLTEDESVEDMEEKVILYVPKDAEMTACKIDMSDNDLYLSGVKCDDMNIHLDYGDVTLENCIFKGGLLEVSDGDMEGTGISLADMAVTVSYGNMKLMESSLDNLTIKKSDGDFDANQLEILGNVELESNYGDVSVRLRKEQKDKISFDLDVSYGKINIDDSFAGAAIASSEDDEIDRFEYNAPDMVGILKVDVSDGNVKITAE